MSRRVALERKLEELHFSEEVRNQKRRELAKKETEYIHERRVRLTGHSFDSIRVIGRGAFGEVFLLSLSFFSYILFWFSLVDFIFFSIVFILFYLSFIIFVLLFFSSFLIFLFSHFLVFLY